MMKNFNKRGKDKLFKVTLVGIIAPLIGLILGIGISLNYDIPNLFSKYSIVDEVKTTEKKPIEKTKEDTVENDIKENENKENSEKIEFDLTDISLYNVQVGSFSTIDNALVLINQMKEVGISGYIFKVEDVYKVFSATFFNREIADEYIKVVRTKYEDSFISQKSIKGKRLSYFDSEESLLNKTKDIIEKLRTIYQQETELWIKALNNIDVDKLQETINNNNSTIENMINSTENNTETDEISKLLSELQNNLKLRKSSLNKLSNNNLIEAHVEFNQALINYINLVTNK